MSSSASAHVPFAGSLGQTVMRTTGGSSTSAASGGSVIITHTTGSNLPFARNWYAHLQRAGVSSFVLIATDAAALAALRTEVPGHVVRCPPAIDACRPHGADDGPPRTCWLDEPWVVATPYFEATRAALRARAALLPYLYTAQRAGYDSGVSLLHPMYYDWPEDDGAYRAAPNGSFAQ